MFSTMNRLIGYNFMARAIGRNFSIAHGFNCPALVASCHNFSSYLVLDIEQQNTIKYKTN
jgi:hypothetical protein